MRDQHHRDWENASLCEDTVEITTANELLILIVAENMINRRREPDLIPVNVLENLSYQLSFIPQLLFVDLMY